MQTLLKQENTLPLIQAPMTLLKPTLSHNKVLSSLICGLRPIDYRIIAGLQPDEKILRKHLLIITIENILKAAKTNQWSLCMNDGQLFIYNSEYWGLIGKPELISFLGKAAEALGVDKYDSRWHAFQADLLKQFMSTAYLPRPKKQSNEVLINLMNGTFAITPGNQAIRNFDHVDFLTYQLPFSFDATATAPVFSNYLNKVLPDAEQQKILAEYAGYIFIKQKTLKLEKALILYGNGANGKSVFFEILTALLGSENVSNYSLGTLTNDNGYFRAKLGTKLLNYGSEISANMDAAKFKLLVSGEPIDARLPFGEPFILTDYAKLIFNCNSLPKDVEHSEAFFRRFLILHFNVTIPEQDRNPELAINIIGDELAGVFNWVLDGLKRLLLNKKFTQSDLVDKTLGSYRLESDAVLRFLSEDGYEPHLNHEVPLKALHKEYVTFCGEAGLRVCSISAFAERLRNAGFDTHRKNAGVIVYISKKII